MFSGFGNRNLLHDRTNGEFSDNVINYAKTHQIDRYKGKKFIESVLFQSKN